MSAGPEREPVDAGDAVPWFLFCASLMGLALLLTWSVRHPVRAVAPVEAGVESGGPVASGGPGDAPAVVAVADAADAAADGPAGGLVAGTAPGTESADVAAGTATSVVVAAAGGAGVTVGDVAPGADGAPAAAVPGAAPAPVTRSPPSAVDPPAGRQITTPDEAFPGPLRAADPEAALGPVRPPPASPFGPLAAMAGTGGGSARPDGAALGAGASGADEASDPEVRTAPGTVSAIVAPAASAASAASAVASGPQASSGTGEPLALADPAADAVAARRDEELATLAGLSGRLRYAPGEIRPGATGAEALARMVEPLESYPDPDVVVTVSGRELPGPREDRALARERAGHVIDRLVDAGLYRGRFLIRIEPDAPDAASGHRVRVAAITDGA